MGDLLFSTAVVVLTSAGLFRLVARGTQACSPRLRNLLALLTLCSGGAYLQLLWDKAELTRVVSHPDMIVLGNWLPLFAAVLAGLVWTSNPGRFRRCLSCGGLLATGFGALFWPLLGSSPQCDDLWQGKVCMQTTPFSCSAASAATVLNAHGILTSEAEMARLCLTRQGTTWMGLYRGLAIKTQDTPWRPIVFDSNRARLRAHCKWPAILCTELPESTSAVSVFRETSGWIPGQGHSVVYFGHLSNDTVEVGDPSFGRELWRTEDLDLLWTGRAIGLVPRTAASNHTLLALNVR
ncbi:MAG: cysteine peptidase family C39 domain-containing protein [Planctomycetota bacterium]|jgi:hypothetical protein